MMWRKYNEIFSDGIIFGEEKLPMMQDELDDLEGRLKKIISIFDELSQSDINMTPFFISYDISNNRVRTHLMNYLLQKGLTRLQRSVYFGQSNTRIFNQI